MIDLPTRMVVEDLFYLVGCALVLWKGGVAERIVGTALLVEFFLSLCLLAFKPMVAPYYVHLALDIGLLAVVLWVAFRYQVRWPLLGSALQLLAALTYIARIIDPSIRSWAYVTVNIALGYGLLFTALYGTARRIMSRRAKWLSAA